MLTINDQRLVRKYLGNLGKANKLVKTNGMFSRRMSRSYEIRREYS